MSGRISSFAVVLAAVSLGGCGRPALLPGSGGPGGGNYADSYPLTVEVQADAGASGRVISTPAGIDCPGTCTHTFKYGEVVQLQAQVAPDAVFGGWARSCEDDPRSLSCSVTMDAAREALARVGFPGSPFWVRSFGSPGSDFDDRGTALTLSPDGALLIAGSYAGALDLDLGPLPDGGSSADKIFIARLGAGEGTTEFADGFPSSGGDSVARDVSASSDGRFAITGYHSGAIGFPGDTTQQPNAEGVFVATFDPSGTYLWSQTYDGNEDDEGRGVCIEGGEAVVVGGYDSNSIDLGIGTLNNGGSWDALVFGADDTGALFGTNAWTSSNEFANDVARRSDGDLVITGRVVPPFSNEVYAVRVPPDASDFQWSRGTGGNGNVRGTSVSLDASENVAVSGYYSGTKDLGTGGDTADGDDPFVAFLDGSNGNAQWVWRATGSGDDRALGVAVGPAGNIVVAGWYERSLDLGNGVTFDSVGDSEDIWVAMLDSAGNLVWARSFGGPGDDRANAVGVDAYGYPYVIGAFADTADFADTSIDAVSADDVFLMRLIP